jgi:hypothetical protein
MTVAKTHNRKDYTAGAPPNNKTYAFDFKIYDEVDLLVYVNGGTPKILNTDYTVSGGPTWTESGGNVVFVNSLVAGDAVLIYRDLTVTQGTHWPEGDPFPSASHENAADRLVMLAQQSKEAMGRVFRVMVSSLLTNIEVPVEANSFLKWNSDGNQIVCVPPWFAGAPFPDHADHHQDGGADEMNVTGLVGSAGKLYFASLLPGVVLDCNIYTGAKIGGGTPTDNTIPINALLATASAINPIILVIDGGAAVKTLIIPNTGYVTIMGLGWHTGFWVMNATDGDFLRTVNHTWTPGAPEAIAGYNVHFKDFYVNINRTGNSTTGDLRGDVVTPYWYTGFHIHAIQNLTFDNVFIYDSPTYGGNIYGCKRIGIDGCQVESPGRSLNTDGFHFNGGCSDVIINNVGLATGDDAIAINVDEGDAEPGKRFIISNIILDNCGGGFRIYGQSTVTDQISISHVRGTIGHSHFLIFGHTVPVVGVLEANLSVTLSDIDVKTTETGQSLIYILASIGSLVLDNVQINSPTKTVSMVYIDGSYATNNKISNLVFNNCQIYRSDAGNFATYLLYNKGVTIQNLSLNNVRVVSQKSATYGAIDQLISMTGATAIIGNFVYRNLDLHDVTNLYTLATGATITNVNTGVKTRYFTRDTAAADGDVKIDGIGFRPSKVHFIAVMDSTLETSDGFDDGTSHYCRTFHTTVWAMDMTHSIVLYQTGAIYTLGIVKSFDQDGFTITWAKTGAKTGTATILCMAYE